MMHLSLVLCTITVLLTITFADLQDKPKISSKGADLHLSSGTGGNIVFEHSKQGKIFFGTQELNFTKKAGPPGPPGKAGIKGNRGDKGDKGNSSGEKAGPKGDKGDQGLAGPPGTDGERGSPGWPGSEGAPGPAGAQGRPGAPGRPGSAGNVGPVIYYTDLDKKSENCNSTMVGVLRYSMKGLQLCTQYGWRNIALDINPPQCTANANIPELNLRAFYNGNPGIMFQFNNNTKPLVNPSDYNANITTEIVPPNSKPIYVESVMRQAYIFTGTNYVNLTGIPETFWQDGDWTVTALVKHGDISKTNSGSGYYDLPLLGIGTNNGSQDELHLGFRGVKQKNELHLDVLFELNDENYMWHRIKPNEWHHIAWMWQKNPDGTATRCLQIDSGLHNCNSKPLNYSGSGVVTIGSWWTTGNVANNITLDHLIISSGLIDYTTHKQQLCFAKLVDKRLP